MGRPSRGRSRRRSARPSTPWSAGRLSRSWLGTYPGSTAGGWLGSCAQQFQERSRYLSVVWQIICAAVAEIVCGLVTQMMPATIYGTIGEMVTAMVSWMETGRLVSVPGGVLRARQAGARMSACSTMARRSGSLARPNQTWMGLNDAPARVTRRRARPGLLPDSGWTPGKSIGRCQARLWGRAGTLSRRSQKAESRRDAG
jgi:hypothetical protein